MIDTELEVDFIWQQFRKCIDLEYVLGVPYVRIINKEIFANFTTIFNIKTTKSWINDSFVYLQDMLGLVVLVSDGEHIALGVNVIWRYGLTDVLVLSSEEYQIHKDSVFVEFYYKEKDVYIVTLG